MSAAGPRVIKLGGSLLDWPQWPDAFRRWLALQAPAANILIVGGGALVEQLRRFDSQQPMAPETAHWLSIRAMSLTAEIVAERLPEARLVCSLEVVASAKSGELKIFEVESLLRAEQQQAEALPCSWEVTSDSISARVAAALNARELVLLKSTLPEGPASREAWSRAGFVDAYFSRVAFCAPLRCVNLRNPEFSQRVIEA